MHTYNILSNRCYTVSFTFEKDLLIFFSKLETVEQKILNVIFLFQYKNFYSKKGRIGSFYKRD